MKPEDIRKLYIQEDAATEQEARQTQQLMTTDPSVARDAWDTIVALSATDDSVFEALFRTLAESVLVDLITNHMRESDEFALVMGKRMVVLMNAARPVQRAGASRHKKTRSA